jgi:hypothetical protein
MGFIEKGIYPNQSSAAETQTPEFLETQKYLQRALDIFKEAQRQIAVLQRQNKALEVTVSQLTNEKAQLTQQVMLATREKDTCEIRYNNYKSRSTDALEKSRREADDWRDKYKAVFKEKEELEEQLREQRQSVFQDTRIPSYGNSGIFPSRAADTDAHVLNDFNTWASNPDKALPGNFRYLEGDFKIRSSNPIRECASPSKWIINKDGSTRFLFPNPNAFNEMTNISELYSIKDGVLKPKGQNRLQITKPCEIKDRDYIDFPGELQLL